jgi:hypothetical protein
MDDIENIRDNIRKNMKTKINRNKISKFISKAFNTKFVDKKRLIYAYIIYKYSPKRLEAEYANYI